MTDVVRDTNPDLDLAEKHLEALSIASTWIPPKYRHEALLQLTLLEDRLNALAGLWRSERAGREKAETALRIAAGALEIASQHATGHDVVLASEVELRGVASSALEIVRAVLAGEGDTDE